MPRKMQRFRSSLFVFLIAVAALAQTASEKPSIDVRRVGARLQCLCGCKDSVATCSMLECHKSKPAKERIAQNRVADLPIVGDVKRVIKIPAGELSPQLITAFMEMKTVWHPIGV